MFAGNDLPGVMLSTAVRRLINLYAVRPGQRAVVLTANAEGDAAVADLKRAGVEVVRVEDARARRRRHRRHRAVRRAGGPGRGRHQDRLRPAGHRGRLDRADLAAQRLPGDRPIYRPQAARFFPDPARLPGDVLVTGGIAGDGSVEELIGHAAAVGAEAARRAARTAAARIAATPNGSRPPGTDAQPGRNPFGISRSFRWMRTRSSSPAGRTGSWTSARTCRPRTCAARSRRAYDGAELAKRFTTATMGPLQGKLETVNTVAVVAAATGATIAETGTTTWRPPYVPVTLAALAGRAFEPVRYSPMQPWHEAHGAVPLVAGAWIRPDRYGDAAAEARNVREHVGIIDVTPIGKLDLRGPDVPALLNLLYVNKWSKLEIGRVRYGVMCAEDGVVLDDGVTGRLGEEHYLMSTTSSGAATIWEWAENWLQTEHPDWRVHVTPVTTAYASMNVAGPQARRLIERVTKGVDLSNEAFPYMHVRTGQIAGVDDCVLWRIGFTGELSYELHVPAGYGLHVWETLLDQRRRPGHPGLRGGGPADSPAREGPFHRRPGHRRPDPRVQRGPGLGHQAGQGRLRRQAGAGLAARRRLGPRLVGLQPVDPAVVPEEASLIMDGRRHRRPDHFQPDVAHPGPVDLPGPGRGPAGRAGHRGDRAAAERAPDRRDRHATARPRGPGWRADACLSRLPAARSRRRRRCSSSTAGR